MKPLRQLSRESRLLWIPGVALALGWALSLTPVFHRLEAMALDAHLRLTARAHYFQDALVIDIDDASLRAMQPILGGWPYPRDVYALLLDYVGEMGARTVAFDILFGDPRQGDASLRAALARNPSVVLAATANGEVAGRDGSAASLNQLAWPLPPGTPAHAWGSIHAPLSEFTQDGHARGGVVSVLADTDGVLRRIPLFHEVAGRYLPTLPLAALTAREARPTVAWDGSGAIRVGTRSLPVDAAGNYYPYYPRNANSVLSIPFSRVAAAMLGLPGQALEPDLFRGKTVFVGSTALSSDRVVTPVGEMNGLYVLAVMHQTMAHGLFLKPPRASWNGLLLLLALLPALMLLRRPDRNPLIGAGASLAAAGGMYALHLALLAGLKQQSVLLFPLMVLAISNLLETMRALRTMHREQNELIHVLAHDDVLTGLPNRFSLQTSMSQAIDQARKTNASLAVMVVDLDRFKAINDPLGHAVGDQILVETGRRLKAALDPADIVARLGSDEFGILIQGANRQHAAERVEQALAALSAPHRGAASQELHVTSSAGISLYPEDGADAATLLRNADTAMHRAKTRGGNTYCFYTADLNQLALERLQIESDLRHALERKQLELFYQPQVDMHTGELIGAEALIRWNHPTLGLLTPDRFVPLAEDSTLILSMGKWVLQTACEQLRSWREQGLTQIRQIAVNLSARQFAQEDLPLLVEHILREFELDPAQLEIEITESVAMQDPERSLNILRTLKQMGVTLAVDDFGTGHSSLTYLKQFPIDILKIDGSFVRDLETNVSDAEICASTIALAHKLGLKVVAEGIETPGQFDFLKRSACDTAQGFGIGLPVRASQIVNFSPSVPVA